MESVRVWALGPARESGRCQAHASRLAPHSEPPGWAAQTLWSRALTLKPPRQPDSAVGEAAAPVGSGARSAWLQAASASANTL
jgi:hypothetical protein